MKDLLLYFLKLGSTGFGGPIALTAAMRHDLVEKHGWISKDDFAEGMVLSQMMPGPLAAQMAIYIGWLRGGALGATIVGIAFILPSLLMVLALGWLYVAYQGLHWLQGAFYGIGASVIAIIVLGAYKLVRKTFENDHLLWTLGLAAMGFTVWLEAEIVWVFLFAGVIAILIKTPPKFPPGKLLVVPDPSLLLALFLFFAKAGAFVFGSGLAVVPFLHGGVVGEHAWLTERQFLDAVAVAMITPGPVVITVAFIGYLVAGLTGGLVAALGIFLPCYLLTVIPAPHFRKIARNPRVKAFVDGVTAAAIGAIAGAAVILGRRAITDLPTVAIAAFSLTILLKFKKVPEPLLILAAGAAGIAINS